MIGKLLKGVEIREKANKNQWNYFSKLKIKVNSQNILEYVSHILRTKIYSVAVPNINLKYAGRFKKVFFKMQET